MWKIWPLYLIDARKMLLVGEKPGRMLLFSIVFFWVLIWTVPAVAGDQPTPFQTHSPAVKKARAVLARSAFQKKLEQRSHPSFQTRKAKRQRQSRTRRWATRRPPASKKDSWGMGTLLLIIIISLAAILGATLFYRWWESRFVTQAGPVGRGHKRTTDQDPPKYRLYRNLAKRGDFLQAVHGLWTQAIGRLAQRANITLHDAMTGRELARLLPQDRAEQESLEVLRQTVEVGIFGERALTQNDYQASVQAFERIFQAP
jgi:hypothetical protein